MLTQHITLTAHTLCMWGNYMYLHVHVHVHVESVTINSHPSLEFGLTNVLKATTPITIP